MNTVLTFLQQNRERFALDRFGLTGGMSTVVVTPRFRASKHVVFLVLREGSCDPVLVVKTPRLRESRGTVEREAANLKAAQSLRVQGFDSIPHVVACEPYRDRLMLVETALNGRPMGPATVRRHLADCCNAVMAWLADVQRPAAAAATGDDDWFDRLIERPLRRFEEAFPVSAEEQRLLVQTREVLSPLRETGLPLVLEHGDLSHPNIIALRSGGAGAIDWELAEPRGLPAADLFFFLSYAAFANDRAASNGRHTSSFHAAFFGRSAWASPHVAAYARRLQLLPKMLTPLFVACWARRVAGLAVRLDESAGAGAPLAADTAAWLRTNRYYLLWRHTMDHLDELNWREPSPANAGGL